MLRRTPLLLLLPSLLSLLPPVQGFHLSDYSTPYKSSIIPQSSLFQTASGSKEKQSLNFDGDMASSFRFGKFAIPASHVFYQSQLTYALVNLRPIVPGHVLVVPLRGVATLAELEDDEYDDLWRSVRLVQAGLREHFLKLASPAKEVHFNVAVQDGRAAGQSVPHVHVHVLPRVAGDLERNDDVYDALEAWEPRSGDKPPLPSLDVPDDDQRKDRTPQLMAEEAGLYRMLVEQAADKKAQGDSKL